MPPPIRPRARIIPALMAGVLIYGLAMGTTYPLLGILLADRVPDTLNGLNAAAHGLGLLIGVALVPPASRRFGAGRTALAGVVLMTASLAVLAPLRDFWEIFGVRLVLGCGASLLFVVAETALNTFAAPARRGRLMGVYAVAVAIGFVVGPAVVAVAADRATTILLACAAITAAALWPLARVRATLDRAIRPTPAARIAPAVAALPWAFGFLVIGSAVDAVVISLLPVIARDQSFPVGAGALFVTVFHIGLLIGQPLVGLALDRLGRRRTVLACCAVSCACVLPLPFGASLGFWPVAALMLVWGGANYGLYTAGLALIGDRFARAALTAATAALTAVYALTSIVSPVIAGGLLDSLGAGGFYLASAAVYLVATLGGGAFFRPPEPACAAPARRAS